MGVEENLANLLGVEHKEPEKIEPSEVVPFEEPIELTDQDEDYLLVRKTLRNLINKGNDAIEEIAQIARANESARGFEVVANLIKTVGETSKDLYNLQKTKKELRDPENKKVDETHINVDKAVFVGTTADLLKTIKAQKEETKG